MLRPSNREIYNKIVRGKETVAKGNILLVDHDVIAEDAIELGYQVTNLRSVLSQLKKKYKFENFIGDSLPMHKVFRIIEKVQDFDSCLGHRKNFPCRTCYFL